ncbi:MAG: hypothetical protein U0992_15140 [Planctomycetaceae bacterium]
MRRHRLAAALSVALLPAVAFGMAMCERGNNPHSALNYPNWPGIIDVVNDLSRESWCWVNGGETLSYRGDTTALNRVLKEFGEVEAEELRVELLPGPGRLQLLKSKEELTDPSDNNADWELRLLQGIVRGHVQHEGMEAIYDMHPTLTIYVTDRIDLNSLEIPARLKVLQHADLRQRYVDGVDFGDYKVRARAKQFLEKFDAKTPQTGAEAEEFKSRLAQIDAFVQKHKTSTDK